MNQLNVIHEQTNHISMEKFICFGNEQPTKSIRCYFMYNHHIHNYYILEPWQPQCSILPSTNTSSEQYQSVQSSTQYIQMLINLTTPIGHHYIIKTKYTRNDIISQFHCISDNISIFIINHR